MTNNLDLSNRINQNYPLLSKKEKHVAAFILENKNDVESWNIKDLSRLTETSNATISRFCAKLHYRNFSEFKTFVSQELGENPVPLQVPVKIASYYTQLINSASQLIETQQITDFVEAIHLSNKILICGVGNSGLSAMELKYRLVRMGLIVDVVTDPHMMLMDAVLLKKYDLMIAISNYGQTQAVIDACTIAKKEHATVFVITNQNHTPLTNIADQVLFASGRTSIPDDQFINSQLPIHFILDVLCYVLLENKSYKNNRKKTISALDLH